MHLETIMPWKKNTNVPPENTRVGRNLRTARLNAKLPQWRVSEVLGVSRGQIAYLEKGQRLPTEAEFETMAGLYGVTVGALRDGDLPLDLPSTPQKQKLQIPLILNAEIEALIEAAGEKMATVAGTAPAVRWSHEDDEAMPAKSAICRWAVFMLQHDLKKISPAKWKKHLGEYLRLRSTASQKSKLQWHADMHPAADAIGEAILSSGDWERYDVKRRDKFNRSLIVIVALLHVTNN